MKTGSINDSRVIACAIILIAIVMTLKFYPGLENEPVYAGVAYQSIHPDAFVNDPYRSPDLEMSSRIIQLSLMYGFVKLVGEIWLDDRFLAVVYIALVIAGLVGVDKTARLLGARGLYERLIILLVFAKDHAVLDHKVLLAHHQDVNHTAFAIPIIVWLFYVALARKGLPIVLALSILLLAMSLRNAPIPILMAMAVVFFTGTRREKQAVGLLSVCGLIGTYWVLVHLMAIPEAGRINLWKILRDAAGGDVNPFHEVFYAPGRFAVVSGIWLTVIAAAYFAACQDREASPGIRIIMLMAFLTWIIGGFYISFAPDFLKFPLLQGIAPTRALAWPQNLAYIVLFASAFRSLDRSNSPTRSALIIGALGILFVLGPGNAGRWAILLAGSAGLVFTVNAIRNAHKSGALLNIRHHIGVATANSSAFLVQTLVVVVGLAYGIAIWQKAPAWHTALETGVFGNAAPAQWIGIAEHIRAHTPDDAIILPIAINPETNAPVINRSFGTRSGRAMPVPEDFPGNFRAPGAWEKAEQQKQVIGEIIAAISGMNYCAAAAAVTALTPTPNYIVISDRLFDPAAKYIGPYAFERAVAGYAVLSRSADNAGNCPQ